MEFDKYRKLPQVISGKHLTKENIKEVHDYINSNGGKAKLVAYLNSDQDPYLKIETLEGEMKAEIGSYVMQGIEGEFWAIKESIFNKTYELVDDVESAEDGADE